MSWLTVSKAADRSSVTSAVIEIPYPKVHHCLLLRLLFHMSSVLCKLIGSWVAGGILHNDDLLVRACITQLLWK